MSQFGDDHDVDGHDFGQGEFNIVILTDTPEILTEKLMNDPNLNISDIATTISTRELHSEDRKVLWSKV